MLSQIGKNKKVAILQSNYIPWKGYFDLINMVDEFIIYDDMQYTKNDWRNRNKIKTKNGLQWITIPVLRESHKQKINETKILNKNWSKKHWKTISVNYSKAPFFKALCSVFEELYLNCIDDFLTDINIKFILTINKLLGVNTKITLSGDYELIDGKTERLIHILKQAKATEYISGPAARDYIDVELFNDEGIELKWMDYSGYQEYRQLSPPFEHGVSILDLIFNEGPNAKKYMMSFDETNGKGN